MTDRTTPSPLMQSMAFSTPFGEIHARNWQPVPAGEPLGGGGDAAGKQVQKGRAGDGGYPCVVLLHGMFGDVDVWSATALNLARAGLEVLAFDLPGHGRSLAEVENADETVQALLAALQAYAEARAQHPVPVLLVGHSFGGLFALHTLFTQPQSFSHYYISSPSIWWGGQRVLDDEKDLAQRLAALPAAPQVRLTVGELEEPAATAPTAAPAAETADPQTAERTRRQQSRRMVSSVRELSQRLARQRGLHVQTHIYPGRTHGSVILPALDDNLRQFWRDLQTSEPAPEKAPRP